MSTMIRKTVLFILFFFCAAAFSYASENKLSGLSVTLSTDKTIYRAGEPVKITITATNKSRAVLDLLFGSGQSYDINITDINKKAVWHWSYGKVFTMAVRHVTLPPHKSLKYNFTWKQLDNQGRRVKPGKYFVQGRLMSAVQLAAPLWTIIIK
jgi:uncharacterized protein (DUF58 family)